MHIVSLRLLVLNSSGFSYRPLKVNKKMPEVFIYDDIFERPGKYANVNLLGGQHNIINQNRAESTDLGRSWVTDPQHNLGDLANIPTSQYA